MKNLPLKYAKMDIAQYRIEDSTNRTIAVINPFLQKDISEEEAENITIDFCEVLNAYYNGDFDSGSVQ